jgi:hypothetical protein
MFISDLLKNRKEFEDQLFNMIIKSRRKSKKLAELVRFSNDVRVIYNYVIKITKKPFPEKEWLIAQNAAYAYHYALDILKGRFEKGEDTISKDAFYSFHYASRILKDRFKKGEEIIIKDGLWLNEYIKFLKSINKLNEFLKNHSEVKL